MSTVIFIGLSFVTLSSSVVLPPQNDILRGSVDSYRNEAFSPLQQQASGTGSFLQLAVARMARQTTNAKRQSVDPLRNDISGYSIQIGVGTPPQYVEVQLDTGSSELWVNPNCSNSWYPPSCIQNGFYTPSSSSTKQDLHSKFSIQYGLGSVSGEYYADNVVLGSANIRAQQFGDATASIDMMEGILGIGWGYGLDTSYYNVIDQLYVQGVTKSRAFSLDLASVDVAQGSIIFGGIDTMKYSGPLQKMPIIPYQSAPDNYPRYWFYLTSLGVTIPGATTSSLISYSAFSSGSPGQAIFPDSGSTFSYLPPTLFTALLAYFLPLGAVNQGGGQYSLPCSTRSLTGTIDFGFGSTVIHVSYHEFIWFDGQTCWFAAMSSTQYYLLGDSFMRSAYIVYDQDNANILVAQAANCGSNIIAITTGTDAVPSVTGGCTPPKSTSASKRPSPLSSAPPLSSSSAKLAISSSVRMSSSPSHTPSISVRSSSSPSPIPSSSLRISPSSSHTPSSSIKISSSPAPSISIMGSSIPSPTPTSPLKWNASPSPSSTGPNICHAVTVYVTVLSTTANHGTCTSIGQIW